MLGDLLVHAGIDSDHVRIFRWNAIFYLVATILLKSCASVLAKQAAITTESASLLSIISNPWYVAEVICLMAQAIIWFFTLRVLPLSFAYPFLSLSFILTFIAALLLFNEPVEANHILGVIIIFVGVFIGSSTAKSWVL